MCSQVILLIGLCVGTLGQAPPLRVTSAPNTFDPNCLDKLSNCWDMPESNCKAPYEQWAKDNCANRCGYCIGPTTPKPECKDKLSNCEGYDKSVCTNPDYTKWVADNCRYYCRMCTQEELARLDAMTTTVSPQNCKDKVDCRAYGNNACSSTFKAWSEDNCPNYCGYCIGLPTPPPACVDHIPNCKAYDADTCTNPNYKLWAEDNCKKFCGLCGQGSGSTSGGAIPITNSPNIPAPMTGHDTPVITYAPPTPPRPGKRHAKVLPVKRQFQASHHHVGQTVDKCWDSNGVECDSEALDKTKDFPGSEYHPRPTPDKNWDSKPSTQAPETSKTKAISSEQTTDPVTTDNLTTNPAITVVSTKMEQSTSSISDLVSSTRILVTSSTKTTTPANTSLVPPPIQSTAIPVKQTTKQYQSTDSTTSSPISKSSSTVQTTTKPIVSTGPSSTLSTGQTSPQTLTTRGTTKGSSGTPMETSQSTAPPTLSTADKTMMSTSTQASPSTTRSTQTARSSSNTAQSSTSPSTPASPPPLITTIGTSDLPSPSTVTQVPPTNASSSSASSVVTNATQPTTKEVCEDTIDNCADYGLRACTTPLYAAWSRAHCARFCEFCKPGFVDRIKSNSNGECRARSDCTYVQSDLAVDTPQNGFMVTNRELYQIATESVECIQDQTAPTLTPFKCENKISNCREFDGGNLCTSDSFFSWARENCFAYCGFHPCGSTTQPMS